MTSDGLLAALSDSEKAVRIAALRAIVRLPLDLQTATEVQTRRAEFARRDIAWPTWVPDDEMGRDIARLVEISEEQERTLARRVIESESDPITTGFAALALGEYAPRSENLLVDGEAIANRAYSAGAEFVPDIVGLFDVYLVFLRPAATFWFRWVREQSHTYNPSRDVPSWFPMYEGPLAVCRQIEWAVSRRGIEPVLDALNPVLLEGGSRMRFAAAQLIEWARRTERKHEPWSFGGGSAPGDILVELKPLQERVVAVGNAKSKDDGKRIPLDVKAGDHILFGKYSGQEIKRDGEEFLIMREADVLGVIDGVVAKRSNASTQPPERKIGFWFKEAEREPVTIQIGKTYTGRFRVGTPVSGDLIKGAGSTVPDSDVPVGGLPTNWTIVPTDARLTPEGTVVVGATGIATFDLLIPESGDSDTIELGVTPLTTAAKLLVLIHIGGSLYRTLDVALEATPEIVTDRPIRRAAETDLQTTHEWTAPDGVLTLYVLGPGQALATLMAPGIPWFPPTQPVTIGTDKADLGGLLTSLRKAADDFRKKPDWTAYLNDVDAGMLLKHLDDFQPQYDWSQFSYFADDDHRAVWKKAAASPELRAVAFYGRRLYDTLFPFKSDSRQLIEQLSPGQRINIVWPKSSEAGWVQHLPWALLYIGDVDSDVNVDGTKFWGHRFRIQHVPYMPSNAQSVVLGRPTEAYCTSALFFGQSNKEPATSEALWQRGYWAGAGSKTRSCIVPSPGTAAPKAEVLKALHKPEALLSGSDRAVAVLYLFCHYGADPNGNAILRFGLDGSDPADVLREPELGTAPFASQPLVFANACATTGNDIYSTSTIAKAFFDRDCRAFIGADCMVPAVLASRVAVIFFHFLLRLADKQNLPMPAGEALAQTRLFLWCRYMNVGGLLYSYLNQYDLYMADQAEINALRKSP
jgi:co-chaperonin GroES (HSP10)